MFLSLCPVFEIPVNSHLNPGDQLLHLTLCFNPVKYISHHFIHYFLLLVYNEYSNMTSFFRFLDKRAIYR